MEAASTILDTMVQSSTVEQLQVFDVAVAPVSLRRDLPPDVDRSVGALINFSGAAFSGELVLVLPEAVLPLVRLGNSSPSPSSDWVREMANQLLGRIRNRLIKCGVELRSGLPRSFKGPLPDRERLKKKSVAAYGFRTLRGDVTVILTGFADIPPLTYSAAAASVNEGDVFLF